MRSLLTLALFTTAPAQGQVPAPVPARVECGALPAGDVELARGEFGLEVEPGAGLARLRLPDRLAATATHPALELVGGLSTVPLGPRQLEPVKSAYLAGILQASLGLVEAPGPRARSGCAELVVERIHLRIGDVLITSAHVAHPEAGQDKLSVQVRVGELSPEPGSAPVPERLIQEKLKYHAESCVRSELGNRLVSGSVSVELRTRDAGVLLPPQAPVDSLDQGPLLFCLLTRIQDDGELTASLPAGAWFYAPFYFRPDDSDRLLIHSQAP